MSFSINFLKKTNRSIYLSPNHALGEIVIGDFHERFESPLDYWSVKDYQSQWKEALMRIIEGHEKSCFITSINNPRSSNFYIWWPIYREDESVFIQNHLFFLGEAQEPFNLYNPYKSVKERVTINGEGQKISEWMVSINEISDFFEKICKKF
jgi:hypothetical protein